MELDRTADGRNCSDPHHIIKREILFRIQDGIRCGSKGGEEEEGEVGKAIKTSVRAYSLEMPFGNSKRLYSSSQCWRCALANKASVSLGLR